MSVGAQRRVVSLWFPRLSSDRVLRARPIDGPFALTFTQSNANRLYCLNEQAEAAGLHAGMSYSDARAFCPDLQSSVANPQADQRFLATLRRWAMRYCPWVGFEGRDGLVLDITGAAHLLGGEKYAIADMRTRLLRTGITVRIGLADTRGAAWALAHFGEGRTGIGYANAGQTRAKIGPLPIAALRLDKDVCTALQRVGLRHIRDLTTAARAPLARRFGTDVLMRLDQALGDMPEQISPQTEPPHYGVRITFPDPIGLTDDVTAGVERLLGTLCDKLMRHEAGARIVCLFARRVDQDHQQVEVRLARPMRDPARILALLQRGIQTIDAGFGIDQLRLEATQVEPMPVQQISHVAGQREDQLDDLITRIGTRIGLENIHRFLPADSHIPERSFLTSPAAYAPAGDGAWVNLRPRPLRLFAPERVEGTSAQPPARFHWRRMRLTTGRTSGPERIAPEWWLLDESWRSGVRDYWRVETHQGWRLWLFYTPQNPSWFVQGWFA